MQRLLVPQRVDTPEAEEQAAGNFDAWEFPAGAMYRVVAIHCQARRSAGALGMCPVVRNTGNDKLYWQAGSLGTASAAVAEVAWLDGQIDQAGDLLSGVLHVLRALRGVWIQAAEATKLSMVWVPGAAAAANNFRNCFWFVEVLDQTERAAGSMDGVVLE